MYNIYKVYALLKDKNNFNIDKAVALLKSNMPEYTITQEENEVTLNKSGWIFYFILNTAEYVLSESKEIAKLVEKDKITNDIAKCRSRVEIISAEGDDPDRVYFNDYSDILKIVESFNGVILVDPDDPYVI